MNLARSVWAFAFVIILILGLNPGTVARAEHAGEGVVVGNCDQDEDGFITNSRKCRTKNPGHSVDCNDNDSSLTINCPTAGVIRWSAEFTHGPFRFVTIDGGVLVFETDVDSPKSARSDTDVVVFPAGGSNAGWSEFFAVCQGALEEPEWFVVPRGRARIGNASDDIGFYLGGIIGKDSAGNPVEFAVQLQGLDDANIEANLGEEYEWRFDYYGLFTKPLVKGKGGQKRCQDGGIYLSSEPTSILSVLP